MQLQRAGRPLPSEGNFEVYAWLFMRVSGVVLLFMALGHLTVMHLLNSVEEIDYDFVAARFATPFWRSYDFVMLVLALLHGINGARTVLEDYVHSGGW
ncbi:MAG: succinate dehydrogenase, hydrophobic membrane anchor protein, partial [Candidatus Latescibacteria bacterium]|nr:succinate dehydrogenase, hydrophobic membrane anchor protein [Candidatus Latescibacterota bacterium]